MKTTLTLAFVLMAGWLTRTEAVQPETAELTFDSRWTQVTLATNGLPAWVRGVEQQGGQFVAQPACWQVGAEEATGVGRLSIALDRQKLTEDLAMSVLYEQDTNADVAVQLLDAVDRVVVLDVFGNLMAVGREAQTDTFIIPLRKYPTVTKIVIRRIRGPVRVYGAALVPVVTEAGADLQTLEQLAQLLGDPVSPDNPLVKGMEHLAKNRGESLQWLPSPERPPAKPGDKVETSVAHFAGYDWHVLPFPVDSDWPGPKGRTAEWDGRNLVLRGQPVRSRRSFSASVTIEMEAVLEQRQANDGSVSIQLSPEGVPLNRHGSRIVTVYLSYRGAGQSDGRDGIGVNELLALRENNRPVGRKLWGEAPFEFAAGKPYRIRLEILAAGMRLTVNDKTYDMPGVVVAFQKFHISLWDWQPTNTCRVRNISVH